MTLKARVLVADIKAWFASLIFNQVLKDIFDLFYSTVHSLYIVQILKKIEEKT